ncbi:NUDIX hydrolase [Pseudoneobacillus sp. C159]
MFIVNVEAAIFKEDKWLVILRSMKEEHAGGTLSLVGGKVDRDGNQLHILEKTVKREIFEEVGIEVKDELHYVYSTSFVSDDDCHVVDIVFLCEHQSGEAFAKSPDEVDDVLWLTTDEALLHPKTPPWLKESLTRAAKLRESLNK